MLMRNRGKYIAICLQGQTTQGLLVDTQVCIGAVDTKLVLIKEDL